ncbi:hypothetical protein GJAV_G00237910 [Gymnothorax javanicus]|nr:hypothetical protein GJAV_G00237910 [Gymnothorax javanicus]
MESRVNQKGGECQPTTVVLQSSLGQIQVAGCEAGVHDIQIRTGGVPAERESRQTSSENILTLDHRSAIGHPPARVPEVPLACVVCERQEEMTTPVQQAVDWLMAYFNDPRTTEKLPLPPFHHPLLLKVTFTSHVLQTLAREVKVGQTVSYQRLAEMAGNSRAVRAVGGAMRRNPVPLLIPCHRVITSSGKSGSYMGGTGNHLKEWLLKHERP